MVRRREPLLAISHCISENDGVVVITGHHTIVLWPSGGNWQIDLDKHIRTVHGRINQLIATDCKSFQTQLTKAYVAETSCNRLLLMDSATDMLVKTYSPVVTT